MQMKKLTAQLAMTGLMALSAAFYLPAASAFDLPKVKIPGVGSETSNAAPVDVDALMTQQKDLMGRFNKSMNNMLLAQSKTLSAGGMKEEAEKASAAAANYGAGSVISSEQLERDTEVSANASKLITDLATKEASLSAEAQSQLLSAVPHYAVGMYEGTKLPDGFKTWADSAQSGVKTLMTDPSAAKNLTNGISEVAVVTENLPALMTAWTTTSKTFLTYAKSNKVDTKDLSSKMGDL